MDGNCGGVEETDGANFQRTARRTPAVSARRPMMTTDRTIHPKRLVTREHQFVTEQKPEAEPEAFNDAIIVTHLDGTEERFPCRITREQRPQTED